MAKPGRTTPVPGEARELEAGLRVILAPNPSPMTHWGTNTYLLGEGEVTLIDPGPALPAHMAAILAALRRGERIGRILVTHAHLDHSPLARPLAAATGAPVLAFGDARAGRSAAMAALAATGGLEGGEGVDLAFRPDEALPDGAEIALGGATIRALHTPGHFGNHMTFLWNGLAFCGDHVMGWASSLVAPPDGDMAEYMASLDRLAALRARRFLPGHGDPIEDPAARIAALRAHRLEREAQILAALADRPATAAELAARIYLDTPPALMAAAARNVLAHLLDLRARGLVQGDDPPGPTARHALV
ncbi:MBL fold metallo-hydrolase [Albidovulum sp.]